MSGDEGSKRLEGVANDQLELRKLLENLDSSEKIAEKAFQYDLKTHIESMNSAQTELKAIPEKFQDLTKSLEDFQSSKNDFSLVFEKGFDELLGSLRKLNEKLSLVSTELTDMEVSQRLCDNSIIIFIILMRY